MSSIAQHMELKDRLTLYRQNNPTYWKLTLETEQAAKQVVNLLKTPTIGVLGTAKDLLIRIEQ